MFLSAGVLPRGTGSGLLERMRLRFKGRGNRVLGALCMEEASGHKEGNNSLKERTKCFWLQDERCLWSVGCPTNGG
jgi:hypothetical protein